MPHDVGLFTKTTKDVSNERVYPDPLTADQAVANGARLLDAYVPDWRSRIDVSLLNIGIEDDCVLGQVFSGQPAQYQTAYEYGLWHLGILTQESSGRRPCDFGFDERRNGTSTLSRISFDDLTRAWQVFLTGVTP